MKKRLLSLLLAVAMMVAVLPTAAFAGDEAGTVNSDLRINADGIPYNVSDKTQNQSNQSVSGNGWKYTHGTNSSWLDLGVDSANYNFDLSDQPALSCEVELYSGTISGGTFNEKISVPYSATDACTISGGVFHGPIYFSGSNSNSSASLKVTGGIFTDSANGFYGPQGRQLRLPLADPQLNQKIQAFDYEGHQITNYEMESSALAGLAAMMGHRAMTVCCIIAGRVDKNMNTDYASALDNLIDTVVERI